MTSPGQPRRPIHGLAPASSLEDVVEYQYWLAPNAFFAYGMIKAAQALKLAQHPAAPRIAAEAEKYRQDLETAVREAATQAAVVRLRNGQYVPYVPSRIFQWRHLTEGWIREALYPALHLAAADIVSPRDPLITWQLDDLEDNIFFSPQSGLSVHDIDRNWFSHGGVTLQPCLLDTPIIYLARDEIEAALRSFWNTYALSIYPDVQCFAEWVRRFGEGGGPVYKTSDESRWVMWLRQLLVWEDHDVLWLGRGMPREWLQNGKHVRVRNAPTMFGNTSLEFTSEVDRGQITATVDLPARNRPREAWLRLRHPAGLLPTQVFVNHRQIPSPDLVRDSIRLVPGGTNDGTRLEVVARY